MVKYEKVVNLNNDEMIIRTDEDGTIWWIPTDPANTDYQAYLNKNNEAVPNA